MSSDPAIQDYFPVATSDLAEEDRPKVGNANMPIQNLPAGGLYNQINLQVCPSRKTNKDGVGGAIFGSMILDLSDGVSIEDVSDGLFIFYQ